MVLRRCRIEIEVLEARALLSAVDVAAMPDLRQKPKGGGPAIVGSIQGELVANASLTGSTFQGTGTVQPMGVVVVTGSFRPNKRTGAVNGHGALIFSNSQGTLTLSLVSHGFFSPAKLRQMSEQEVRLTVQVQSATGQYTGIRVKGTTDLVTPENIRTVPGRIPAPSRLPRRSTSSRPGRPVRSAHRRASRLPCRPEDRDASLTGDWRRSRCRSR